MKNPKLSTKELQKKIKTLSNSFLFLNDPQEIFEFLRDLLTVEELQEFQKRFDIAVRLHYKIPYTQIQEELGVSSTTVARVSKYLKGNHQGYEKVIQRMFEDKKNIK